MVGRIRSGIFLQAKPIVPGVNFSVTLEQSIDAFRIMSGGVSDEKFVIISAVLKIKRISITPTYLLTLERALLSAPASYPVMNSTVRTAHLAIGTTGVVQLRRAQRSITETRRDNICGDTQFQRYLNKKEIF